MMLPSLDFYPRPPRGGRRASARAGKLVPLISIHALREEGDLRIRALSVSREIDFYPRPPRGGRHGFNTTILHNESFLSTPSARRATSRRTSSRSAFGYFYPRPPRGGRRSTSRRMQGHRKISIHALREEGDEGLEADRFVVEDISIHALREEGDRRQSSTLPSRRNFYPRPPRGGRPRNRAFPSNRHCNFYPRPPRGGRRSGLFIEQIRLVFLSTPSARRATRFLRHYARNDGNFYPRPPRGGRQLWEISVVTWAIFLSTPSARRATRIIL